jgi:hypothetical protein
MTLESYRLNVPVHVEISPVEVTSSSIRAGYSTDAPIFAPHGELFIEYPTATYVTDDDLEQILTAVFLPMAALSGPTTVSFPFEARRKDYWQEYLARFDQLDKQVTWKKSGLLENHRGEDSSYTSESCIGILFGGGVESMFGVSLLAALKPRLFALVGPAFMNNDHGRSNIKRDVEDRFEARFGLPIHRISTNARALFPTGDDSILNKFVTGAWFYFFLRPLLRKFGVNTLFKASEYEEAANFTDFDLSLNPRFINKITDGPLFLPLLNAYSKMQMFEELSHTPYFDYIYSCLNNTSSRWCGTCSKCRRLAEYGRRLKIDTERIELDPTIPYFSESSPISRHYALVMETLRPTRDEEMSLDKSVAEPLPPQTDRTILGAIRRFISS